MPKLTIDEVQRRISASFEENVILVGSYQNKRTNISLKCQDCGYEWETKAQNVLYLENVTKHHCPNCWKNQMQNGKFLKCSRCGKEIYRTKSQIEKNQSGYFYCSTTCGNLHKNLVREQSGEWESSLSTYRKRAFEEYEHRCCVCGWNEDERILEVHHKDEDRRNNHINNLCILCPNCHRKITLHYYSLTEDNKLIMNE